MNENESTAHIECGLCHQKVEFVFDLNRSETRVLRQREAMSKHDSEACPKALERRVAKAAPVIEALMPVMGVGSLMKVEESDAPAVPEHLHELSKRGEPTTKLVDMEKVIYMLRTLAHVSDGLSNAVGAAKNIRFPVTSPELMRWMGYGPDMAIPVLLDSVSLIRGCVTLIRDELGIEGLLSYKEPLPSALEHRSEVFKDPRDQNDDAKVNPTHYKSPSGMEAIQVVEAFGLSFCLGNTVKYVLRAGKKPGQSASLDLKKAIWYLEREIATREKQPTITKVTPS